MMEGHDTVPQQEPRPLAAQAPGEVGQAPAMHAARRQWLAHLGTLGAFGALAALGWRGARAQAATPQVVQVIAKRFAYEPSDIVVRAGVPIVLEVKSLDFAHGMSFPDLNLRADLVPGKPVRITLPAQPAGMVDFLCDNFCGDDHETMHGRLLVQA